MRVMHAKAHAIGKMIARDVLEIEHYTDAELITPTPHHRSRTYLKFDIGDTIYAKYNVTTAGRRNLVFARKALPEDYDFFVTSPKEEADRKVIGHIIIKRELAGYNKILGIKALRTYFRAVGDDSKSGLRECKELIEGLPAKVDMYTGVEANDLITKLRDSNYEVVVETFSEAPEPKAEQPAPTPKVETPKLNPLVADYYIAPEVHMVFNAVDASLKADEKRIPKVMMLGPSGYGKTTLPKLFANVKGMEYLRVNCAQITDPEEWFGIRKAAEGSTTFERTTFTRMIEEGNAVIVLDEYNRLAPELKNTLFPLLDDDQSTEIHNTKITAGPNVVVVATVNHGTKYVGTFDMDFAEMNRFDYFLEVGPMPASQEARILQSRYGIKGAEASTIVSTINQLRNKSGTAGDFSTRTSLQIASAVRAGMNIRQAFQLVVVTRIFETEYDTESRRTVIDIVNTSLGVYEDNSDSGVFYV